MTARRYYGILESLIDPDVSSKVNDLLVMTLGTNSLTNKPTALLSNKFVIQWIIKCMAYAPGQPECQLQHH